jgi:aminopeptidase N
MIKCFEEYVETNYPYKKYAQVAVEDFEFGGMENTSCTTLTRDILFDKKKLHLIIRVTMLFHISLLISGLVI